MDFACPSRATPQFLNHLLPVCGKIAKADNLLITKGKLLDFSLPKAENILKINLLQEIPKNGFCLKKRPRGAQFDRGA
jgi:hypothetical protein